MHGDKKKTKNSADVLRRQGHLQGLRSPEASQTQLGRVKAICDLARLASGIIVVISVFNLLLNNMFSFVYRMARAHGVLLCVRHYTHTLSDT